MQLKITSGSGVLAFLFFICLAMVVMCRKAVSSGTRINKVIDASMSQNRGGSDPSAKHKKDDNDGSGSIGYLEGETSERRNPYTFIRFKSKKISKVSPMA